MSLNIKNERVHEMVRRLAELGGQSQASAVEDAVRRRLNELERSRAAEVERKRAAIGSAARRFQALPLTGQSIEEIMGDMYDESGLPR